MEKITIEGVELHLIQPDLVPMVWVGQEELVTQVIAAWLVIGDDDFPLNPRLVGKRRCGKNYSSLSCRPHSGQTRLSVPGHHGYKTRGSDCYPGHIRGRKGEIHGKSGGFCHDQGWCCGD